MTKPIDWLVILIFALNGGCGPGGNGIPSTAVELASQLADAAEAKDREALLALVKWDGVGQQLRSSHEGSMELLLDYDVAGVGVEALPEQYRQRRLRNRIEYRPNVELEGVLRIRFGANRPAGSESVAMPFGFDSEGYRIAGTTETTLEGAVGSGDVSINIIVVGGGAPEPVGFAGSCRVLRSGVEVTETFEGAGNLTNAVWGQTVRNCEVRRTSEEGWIELRISVSGERVYSSQREEGGNPVVYESTPAGA